MKNKYLQDTKKKLAQYKMIKGMCEIRKKDILNLQARVEYTEDELEKTRLEKEIKRLKIELSENESTIFAIEKGFSYLTPSALNIIQLKYIEKESWIAVGLRMGYGQSRCKEIGREALLVIGECLHGLIIHQDLPLIVGEGCY